MAQSKKLKKQKKALQLVLGGAAAQVAQQQPLVGDSSRVALAQPPSGAATQTAPQQPPRGGRKGKEELAVNQQPVSISGRADPRLPQPVRGATPLMTPNQVVPQVAPQGTPVAPIVRVPSLPQTPSFPPPLPICKFNDPISALTFNDQHNGAIPICTTEFRSYGHHHCARSSSVYSSCNVTCLWFSGAKFDGQFYPTANCPISTDATVSSASTNG